MTMPSVSRFSPLALLLLAACSGKESLEPEAPTPEDETPRGMLELRASSMKVPVLQGESAEVKVQIVRHGDVAGHVRLSARGLPEGVTMSPSTPSTEADEITLTFEARAQAPHSLPVEVQLHGTAALASGAPDKAEGTVDLILTVCGHPGALDTSFERGRVVVPVGAGDDYANAMAVTQEGKLLVAGSAAENLGDFALIRLERDGRIDATFGRSGKVVTAVGAGSDIAHAMAIQDDGKIVLVGSTSTSETGLDIAVVRYLADGSLDANFGKGGKVVVSLSKDSDVAHAVLIQKDGKIVAAGQSSRGSSSTGLDFALVRLEPDGTLDETFGDGGSVVTPVADGSTSDVVYALASQEIEGEERLVAAGGEGDFALARYTPDGTLDASFGNEGTLRGVLGSVIGSARSLEVTARGELLAAGHHGHDFALARVTDSGAVDTTFGEDGVVITPISAENWDEARGLAIESGGKIVIGGWAYAGGGSSGDFALARYSADGELDVSFGNDGIVLTEVAPATKNDVASAVLLQADDRVPTVRVLLAGSANGSNHDFAVTRYWR
jgi:uncharacterized delta-60 repeat protein